MKRLDVGVIAIAVATLVNYGAWIAWDQGRTLKSDGQYSDPYRPWQIIGLVGGLIVIAAVASWRGRPTAAIGTVTPVLTLCFSVDWATDPPAYNNDGLWAIGAVMVAIATSFGVALVARIFQPNEVSGSPSIETPPREKV